MEEKILWLEVELSDLFFSQGVFALELEKREGRSGRAEDWFASGIGTYSREYGSLFWKKCSAPEITCHVCFSVLICHFVVAVGEAGGWEETAEASHLQVTTSSFRRRQTSNKGGEPLKL